MRRIRITFDIDGDMAAAFLQELAKQVPASKAEIGRAALVEYLNARGHDVTDETQRGGYRGEKDTRLGQPVGVGAR